MSQGGEVPVRSEKGKEILAHAMGQEHCVLEFVEKGDGSMMITDITEHVEALEQMVDNK